VLQGKNPRTLPFLGRDCNDVGAANAATTEIEFNNKLDFILHTAVEKWAAIDNHPPPKKRAQPKLTTFLSSAIEEQGSSIGISSAAQVAVNYRNRSNTRIDILLSPHPEHSIDEAASSSVTSTPLALIEVGHHDVNWWKNLDQNFKYLVNMANRDQPDPRLRVEKPLFLVVLTIQGEASAVAAAMSQRIVKLGVFLCSPRKDPNVHHRTDFRMILLSHFRSENLLEASKAFGHLLRATSLLDHWRENKDETVDSYEYFSSNCCRVGQYVSTYVH
jgi:hypothetical protein